MKGLLLAYKGARLVSYDDEIAEEDEVEGGKEKVLFRITDS